MKSSVALMGLLALLCVSRSPASANTRSTIINGSFEDGLNGWDLDWEGLWVSHETAERADYPYPGSSIPPGNRFGYGVPFPTPSARDGDHLYGITVRDNGPEPRWTMPDGHTYSFVNALSLTLHQTFHATAGTTITGWAYFGTGCPNHEAADEAHGASTIAIGGVKVWHASPLTLAPPPAGYDPDEGDYRYGEWDQWFYEFPADGDYELRFQTEFGCEYTSTLAVDAISIIPEPNTLALLGLGGCAMEMARRRGRSP